MSTSLSRTARALRRRALMAGRLVVLLFAALNVAPAARADVHGGIEIGAKGVKATAINVIGNAGAYDVKVLMAATENTTLAAGLGESGRFAPDAVKVTAGAVAKFAAALQTEHKVPAENLYVVGSSGLFSAIEGKPDSVKANQDALAKAVREACGLKMTFIDVKRETELSIAGVIPPGHVGASILIDIGSGNTKGGFRDGDKGAVTFGVPFGSVTFADAARKRVEAGSYADKASALRQAVLGPALKKAIEDKPALAQRERVYLGGGAVWAMASLVRPGGSEPYMPVTPKDVAAYRKLLLSSPGEFPKADLATLGEKERAAAAKEIDRVRKTFTPEQLLAGAEVLQALSDEFGFKDRKVCFARNAYLAWILAYVTEKGAPR
jgi:exopolyphosphatase/pppGpp-phosphohydrolase